MDQKRQKKTVKIINGIFVLAILATGLILLAAGMMETKDMKLNSETVESFNDGWRYALPTGEEGIASLPERFSVEKGEPLILSKQLPTNYIDGMTLCIRSSQQTVRALIEDRVVYEYGIADGRAFGKSPGSAWNLIRVHAGDEGKMLTLELTSAYENSSGIANPITIGSKSANLFYIVEQNMAGFMACVLIVLVGIAFLCFRLFITRNKHNQGLEYLGIFAILVGVWALTETKMLQVFWGNTFNNYLLAFMTLALCPVPFLMFIAYHYRPQRKKLYFALCLLFLANFFLLTLLQIADLLDYFETLIFVHLLIGATILFLVAAAVAAWRKDKDSRAKMFVLSTIILTGFAAVDIFRFYFMDYADSALFFRYGILVYLLILGYGVIKEANQMLAAGKEAELLKKIAFLDALTKLRNRAAFDTDFGIMNGAGDKGTQITICMFDVDHLKRVNDTYGHGRGDALLISAADCINTAFHKKGFCYRIGGDEFVALLKNCSRAEIDRCLETLEKNIEEYNRENKDCLEISWGTADYRPEVDRDLHATLKRADENMYHYKKRKKSYEQ